MVGQLRWATGVAPPPSAPVVPAPPVELAAPPAPVLSAVPLPAAPAAPPALGPPGDTVTAGSFGDAGGIVVTCGSDGDVSVPCDGAPPSKLARPPQIGRAHV